MIPRIPDWLRYEWIHFWEGFQGDEGLRERLNRYPQLVIGLTILAICVLGIVLVTLRSDRSESLVREGSLVWFYDLNTDKLFCAKRNKLGPIEVPTGPMPNGDLAGVRAHVYSYVVDPNEDDLFVGFLDKPDPDALGKRPTWKRTDFEKWTQYRVIRRVKDQQWVPAASESGQKIIRALTRPNAKGQTPQYQLPQ
ncbi:hypothetical protein ACFL6U_26535 [Planctomycetota bacterium]